MLSENGRRLLFPVLYCFAKYCKKDIYHYVIGGQLGKEVNEKKNWSKYINRFRGNWLESKKIVSTLREKGVQNAIYLLNFKSLSVLKETVLLYVEDIINIQRFWIVTKEQLMYSRRL